MNTRALLIGGVTALSIGWQPLRGQAGAGAQNIVPPAPIESKINAPDKMTYVFIPPGTFRMGCSKGEDDCIPGEKPAHDVTLTKSFWIAQTEVTVLAYKRFVELTKRPMLPEPEYSSRSPVTLRFNPGWADDQQPIVNATWFDAVAYCAWAGGRLPTEAEWEYAARAGENRPRYGDPDEIAWYAENSGRAPLNTLAIRHAGGNMREIMPLAAPNGNRPHSVGQKKPNAWGLFDMLGNVHEWVADWYGNYEESHATDPTGPTHGEKRVVRGGEALSPPWLLRLSLRTSDIPAHGDAANGFRCVLDAAR